MKPTKGQAAIFYLGCLLIVFAAGVMWLPLGMTAAGVLLITIAVILADAAEGNNHE